MGSQLERGAENSCTGSAPRATDASLPASPAPPSPHLQDEWLDLPREHRLGRLQLLPGGDPAAWPPTPTAPTSPEALEPIDRGGEGGTGAAAAADSSGTATAAAGGSSMLTGGKGVEEGDEAAAGAGAGESGVTATVRVICGTVCATFDARTTKVILQDGRVVSPSGAPCLRCWEMVAGRAC